MGRVSYKILVILWDCIESCVLSSLKLLLVVQYCVTLYYIMNKYRIQCYLPFFFRHLLDNNLFDLIYSAHPLSPFWQSIIEATSPGIFSRGRGKTVIGAEIADCVPEEGTGDPLVDLFWLFPFV